MTSPLQTPPLKSPPSADLELEGGHNGHVDPHSPEAHAGEIRQASQAIRERLAVLDRPDALHDEPAAALPKINLKIIAILVSLIVAASALVGVAVVSVLDAKDPYKGLEYRPLERGKVILTIVEKGNVEAVKNTEIICQVRSSGRGSSSTTIVEVKENGAWVEKGDVVMQLDDSALKDQFENQKIIVEEKKSLYTQALTDMEILKSQIRSDLRTAEDRVRLAELDLEMYDKGNLEQKRRDIEGRLTLARSEYFQWQEKVETSARLLRKKAINQTQYDSDLAKFDAAAIKLRQIEEEKRVLEEYERERNLVDYRTRLAQARENLNVVRSQVKGKMAQADALLRSRESALNIAENQLNNLLADINNCRITAPNKGRIVYFIEQTRFGANQQSPIAPGQPVQFGQKLMRIPDPDEMQVRVKIHESIVLRVVGDEKRPTGFGARLTAGMLAPLPDWTGVVNAVALPSVRSLFDKHEEEIVSYGLPAEIKVPAREKPLAGRVSFVAPGESTIDFSQPDVKVYETLVVIEEKVEGLKPGMSAEVVILVDESADDVKRVPVQCVLEVNGHYFIYVKGADGKPERRWIEPGLNNNKFIEITDKKPEHVKDGEPWGVEDGEEVVQNPRELAERLGHLSSDYKDRGDNLGGKKDRRPRTTANASAPPRTESTRPAGQRPTPEQMQAFEKQLVDNCKGKSPEQVKALLEQIPAQGREWAKQVLRKHNIPFAE